MPSIRNSEDKLSTRGRIGQTSETASISLVSSHRRRSFPTPTSSSNISPPPTRTSAS